VDAKMIGELGARRSWGLVLSGGAACGLANIGTLEVLHEARLRPDCVAGSSMGAIVAALYALGHPPEVLSEVAASLAPLSVVGVSNTPLRAGLHGGLLEQRLDEHLGPLVGDRRIGECAIPFVCVAGRVRAPVRWERMLLPGFVEHVRGQIESHVFGPETRIIDAVRASSAIPVVFSPAEIDGETFVDLVHFGPIPARSLRAAHSPELVVATDTQPPYDHIEPWMPGPMREFLAAGREETALSLAACDLVIRPRLPASMLRFDLGDEFAAAGRAATEGRLEDIRSLLAAPA